jgi:hypothetical protein
MSKGLSAELTVGRNAFYQGKIVKIIASYKKSFIVQDHPNDHGYQVKRNEIEAVVSEVFPMDTRVQSTGSFKGRVTGYEHETNRVVTVSDKIHMYQGEHKDRTRYAYKVNELTICIPMFEMNKVYHVQTHSMFASKVRVLEHPVHKDMFALHDADTGAYVVAVDRNVTFDNIYQYGLS